VLRWLALSVVAVIVLFVVLVGTGVVLVAYVFGWSMYPTLEECEVVVALNRELYEKHFSENLEGTLVVYRVPTGVVEARSLDNKTTITYKVPPHIFIAHRVVEDRGDILIVKGDFNDFYEIIQRDWVYGVVVAHIPVPIANMLLLLFGFILGIAFTHEKTKEVIEKIEQIIGY